MIGLLALLIGGPVAFVVVTTVVDAMSAIDFYRRDASRQHKRAQQHLATARQLQGQVLDLRCQLEEARRLQYREPHS